MHAVLFDFDGTLADTAPDLGYALNLQRQRHGLEPLPDVAIRPYASHGTRGLLKIGFNLTAKDAVFDAMRQEYLALYDEVFCHQPSLFDGMDELLQALEKINKPWGIVTNKPARFTLPMVEKLGLNHRAACVVSGDDCARPKPHPDTLLLAAEQMGIVPADAVYVGDAERDIVAGRAAGMHTIIARYGYLSEDDAPEAWGADAIIDTPDALLSLLL
jgi:phosphoglycolate phosphatase